MPWQWSSYRPSSASDGCDLAPEEYWEWRPRPGTPRRRGPLRSSEFFSSVPSPEWDGCGRAKVSPLHQPRPRRPCGEDDALAARHRRHGMPCEAGEEHTIAAVDALNFSPGDDQPAARPFACRHQRNGRRDFALVAGEVVVVRVRVGEIADSVSLNAHRLENSRQREAPGVVPDKGQGQLLERPRSVLRLQIAEADAPVDPPPAAAIDASVLFCPLEQLGTFGGGEQRSGDPHPPRPLDRLWDRKDDIL